MSLLLPPFTLHEPTSVKEAVELAARHGPDVDYVAGGTDLLPNYKWGLNARRHVVSLLRIPELSQLTPEAIGATVRLTQLERSAEVAAVHSVLPRAAKLIASPLIRNSGTVGGNVMLENRCYYFNQSYLWRAHKDFCLKADGDKCLVVPQKERCYATFSADLPAPLLALDASYELVGRDGARTLRAREFYAGDGIQRNVRKPGELLVRVTIPREKRGTVARYEKLRLRGTWDFPEAGVCVAARFDGATVREMAITTTGLESVPRTHDALAQALVGAELTDERIDATAKALVDEVNAYRNTSFPPAYRKKMTGVLFKRAARGARDDARGLA